MIIGVTGKKQSGKDTLADYLVTNYGYMKIAFADALKDATCALFSITREQLMEFKDSNNYRIGLYETVDEPEAICEMTVRVFLQRMGTEAGRNILGQDVWLDIVQDHIDQKGYTKVVISDCRFPNEVAAIKNYRQGIIINIVRYSTDQMDSHASENVPSEYDYRIHNNHSTFSWYYHEIDYIMEILGESKIS